MVSQWNIDPVHTHAQFSVRHLMVSNVKGVFAKTSGTVTLDEDDFVRSKIHVVIDAASLDTREPQRDQHLRSADFFDVAHFPDITFDSRRIEPQGDGFAVTGDLTIRGVSCEARLSVENPSPAVKDPWGGIRRGFEARCEINRKDYGLVWNQILETGGVAVGDLVKISLEIELVKAA